jgi:dihydrofolate synthase/folylpolyglutamate synthase
MAQQSLDVALVIQEHASRKGVKLYSLDQHSYIQRTSHFTDPFETFTLNSGITGNTYQDIQCKPLGSHQISNASVAIIASELLTKSGFIVAEQNFRDALSTITIPCRFETIKRNNIIWILDGAHTFHSCEFVAKTIKERYPNQKVPIIFGCKHNKNAQSLIKPLIEVASSFIFTDIPEMHSAPLKLLCEIVESFCFSGPIHCYYSSESTSFLDSIQSSQQPVLITGSLILTSYFRTLFLNSP